MKQLLTILLLCLPLCVLSQSRESNKLYKQGMKLYKAEKYEEALPYFQKSDSLDKATLPPTSENYYRAELKLADCWDEIAWILDDDGKYAEALNLEKKVVEIYKKALGEEHPDYAEALNDLACYYDHNGNYSDSYTLGNPVSAAGGLTVADALIEDAAKVRITYRITDIY
ncbi:MAG: tetratricopeptide repeat protein, partial [Bacteroidales bacterium]|nr:tetratricopeptide repeat protein [Bacteroidales bacterium]